MNHKKMTLDDAIAKYTNKEGDCLIWTGSKCGKQNTPTWYYRDEKGKINAVRIRTALGHHYAKWVCGSPLCINSEHAYKRVPTVPNEVISAHAAYLDAKKTLRDSMIKHRVGYQKLWLFLKHEGINRVGLTNINWNP